MNTSNHPIPIPAFLSAKGRRFAIVAARFNENIVGPLLEGARATLTKLGASVDEASTIWVPGAFEIPLAAKKLAETGKYDAIVCLGAVIRGDTPHFDYISSEVAAGVNRVSLDTGVPCIFGVLTCDTLEQAEARSGDGPANKGVESAVAAAQMASVLASIERPDREE